MQLMRAFYFLGVDDETITAIEVFNASTIFIAEDSGMHPTHKFVSDLNIVFRTATNGHRVLIQRVLQSLVAD